MNSSASSRYENLLCEFYDFITPCTTRPDRNFFVGYSQAAKGPTLELGCGTGRLLIPTAEAGCSTVGLDLSGAMLAKCRERLRRLPRNVQSRVRLVRGNMAAFDLQRKFGLITIPYRGFQHLLSMKNQIACLQCANRHLRRGGKLILDLFQTQPGLMGGPIYQKEVEVCRAVRVPDGRKFRMTTRVARFHPMEQYNEFEMIFYVTHPERKKERVVEKLPLRYLFRFEAEHLLARCGFRVVNTFGSFVKTPLKKNSRHWLIVAEKIRPVPYELKCAVD